MSTDIGTAGLVSGYTYDLPPDRIAQRPLPRRDSSRLLLVDGPGLTDLRFTDLPQLLRPGDLLVANDTRVRAARLRGTRPGGGPAELLVLAEVGRNRFVCLVRPARRLREATVIDVGEGLRARILGPAEGHPGARLVAFEGADDAAAAIESLGTPPLPPYIHERLEDPRRYQTVFAAGAPRSAAAPTAGLHMTGRVLEALRRRGVGWATLRLEVGLGTFTPMTVDRIDEHEMHEEPFAIPAATARAIGETRRRGGRVVAVGTTAARALETAARGDGSVAAGDGASRLFIRPGHHFQVVDGLVTNFHQPGSTLLLLLAALIGEGWRGAYDHALAAGYRFLSFGDCMLAWRTR